MAGATPQTGIFWKQVGQALLICGGGTLTFLGVSVYRGNEKVYREFVMPVLHKCIGPESAHKLTVTAAKYKLIPTTRFENSPLLKSDVFGLKFDSPVGLAAGLDKHGEAVDGFLGMGFGFVEVGSVTPEPQPGNPLPRVFRLNKDRSVINRYGFNSDGHEVVYTRLKEQREHIKSSGILGINLGKNKASSNPEEDYVKGVEKFGNVADYLVINVSSPNTPGLRELQGRKQLDSLLQKVVTARNGLKVCRKPPILVKISPDLSQKDKEDIAAVVCKTQGGADGLIVSNTTVQRPDSLTSRCKSELGGLSGVPLKSLSTAAISDMYKLTKGKIPIIGVGGITSGSDAYEKIRAGASLVQIYTVLVYQGPPAVNKIKRELADILKKEGFSSLSEAVGIDHR